VPSKDNVGRAARIDEQAESLIKQKKYGEALPLLQIAAAAGNAQAIRRIGLMYGYGEGGLPIDPQKSNEMLRKAAAAGSIDAMLDLAKPK
jgi:TPR repeat protein